MKSMIVLLKKEGSLGIPWWPLYLLSLLKTGHFFYLSQCWRLEPALFHVRSNGARS